MHTCRVGPPKRLGEQDPSGARDGDARAADTGAGAADAAVQVRRPSTAVPNGARGDP
jgi:hypothetical protein